MATVANTKLYLTLVQQQEIDALFNNERLKRCISTGLTNPGANVDVGKKLAQQEKAVEILAAKDESFWSYE